MQNNNQDVEVKLLALRQPIWTGVGNYDWDNDESMVCSRTNNFPLSWGVSKMAFEYQSDSEALLL